MEPVLYDIKDAARYLGVAPSTLRYWEREGLVRAGRNRGNDYRQYALHDLIDASEIAFYRRLGVPVRELAGYRTLSARDLDDALDRTARDVEQRIAELEAMRARLARQRALNARAEELEAAGMRPGAPGRMPRRHRLRRPGPLAPARGRALALRRARGRSGPGNRVRDGSRHAHARRRRLGAGCAGRRGGARVPAAG
ncbi:MerR family transcriptional regulator [Gordonibacter urolithinfaciens]|uniref:MerR family transcriptional regulator n=1 Tax=Gordonibacter urolithinfaciens TaxID=1335613 RepID=UPI003A92CA8D